MKARVLHEPELGFRAGNRHIDPRNGLAVFGPADAEAPSAPRSISVGLVGPPRAVDGLRGCLRVASGESPELTVGDLAHQGVGGLKRRE